MPAFPAPNSEVLFYVEDHPVTAQTITASGTQVVSGNFGLARDLILQVVLATVTGTTPSYTFSVEGSLDGSNWYSLGALSAITAAGTGQANVTTPLPSRVRVKWVVTGTTPSAVVDVYVATKSMTT